MSTQLSRSLQLPCGVLISNRICKSATTEGLADMLDKPTERLNNLYEIWAKSGAGLIISGNIVVDRRYLERVGNVVVEDCSSLLELKELSAAGTRNGTQFWAQINHPGRQCTRFVVNKPIGPSATQLKIAGIFGKPRAMTESDIKDVIERFKNAASILKLAGFAGVQIHSAHGYLLSSFLSPRTNQREDKWGGSLENRARLLLSIVSEVRKAVGKEFPVSVKLNSSDFQKGGFTLKECVQVVKWLSEAKVDLLEISGGTYENASFFQSGEQNERARTQGAFFLKYAEAINEASTVPIMLTGGFRYRSTMESVLEKEQAHMIGIARPFCIFPDFPIKLLKGGMKEIPRLTQKMSFGKGILSRNSKSFLIRTFGSQAEVNWYYLQIMRLSEGKRPIENLSIFKALLLHSAREISKNQKRKRAQRKRGELAEIEIDRESAL